MKTSKILKVAGLSFAGFCAVSVAADRVDLGPMASQLAGFCGAFVGAMAARRRRREKPAVLENVADHSSSSDERVPEDRFQS